MTKRTPGRIARKRSAGSKDKPHRHAFLFVEFGFKREQREHQIAAFANLQHALLTPCPNRWADVMHGLDPGLTQFEFDVKGEIRSVDADENIRLFGYEGRDQ